MKRILKENYYKIVSLKEDTTKFGEFVCSCHKWLPIEEQKENAERLEKITKT